jgi:hypothetical protein
MFTSPPLLTGEFNPVCCLSPIAARFEVGSTTPDQGVPDFSPGEFDCAPNDRPVDFQSAFEV